MVRPNRVHWKIYGTGQMANGFCKLDLSPSWNHRRYAQEGQNSAPSNALGMISSRNAQNDVVNVIVVLFNYFRVPELIFRLAWKSMK